MELPRKIPLTLSNTVEGIGQLCERAQNLCKDQPECAAHHEYGEKNHAELDVLGGFDLCLACGIVGDHQLVDLRHKGRDLFRHLCLCGVARLHIRSLGNGAYIGAVRFPQRLHDPKLTLHRLIRWSRQSHRGIALLQSRKNPIIVREILLHRRAQRLCITLIRRSNPCRLPRELIGTHPQRPRSVDRRSVPLQFVEGEKIHSDEPHDEHKEQYQNALQLRPYTHNSPPLLHRTAVSCAAHSKIPESRIKQPSD